MTIICACLHAVAPAWNLGRLAQSLVNMLIKLSRLQQLCIWIHVPSSTWNENVILWVDPTPETGQARLLHPQHLSYNLLSLSFFSISLFSFPLLIYGN